MAISVENTSPEHAIRFARAAIAAIDIVAASPFSAANARARSWAQTMTAPEPLLKAWLARHPGSAIGDTRYRWDISDRRCPLPSLVPGPNRWQAFRAVEQPELERDPFAFEERISLPVLLAESCEYLEELCTRPAVRSDIARDDRTLPDIESGASQDGADATISSMARELLEEADPVLRRDLANFALASHPWTDTFALFCLSRTPRALARLRPIATAIAVSYALLASRANGAVLGARFPFHDKPLVSASAHLAVGLWALGLQLSLLAPMVDYLRRAQRPTGGWGDDTCPEDLATTFVAADLLTHIDPHFDPTSAVHFVLSRQRETGLFVALGPEAPWLTACIGQWIQSTERPFPDRFRWPEVAHSQRDRKTDLPFYAYFDDLARVFADLPGISRTSTQIAFLDLIGFRAHNNRFGQGAGDAVLAELASELRQVPRCSAIRDGGDEFLLLGAPGNDTLYEDIQSFRKKWPIRFRETFGRDVPVVAPRIIVERTPCGTIRRVREELGRAIGDLKGQLSEGALGVLRGP